MPVKGAMRGLTRRAAARSAAVLCSPVRMPLVEQAFDSLLVLTNPERLIIEAALQIAGGHNISMVRPSAALTAERLLVGTVGTGGEVAARAFLGGVSRVDGHQGDTAFGGSPFELLHTSPN